MGRHPDPWLQVALGQTVPNRVDDIANAEQEDRYQAEVTVGQGLEVLWGRSVDLESTREELPCVSIRLL